MLLDNLETLQNPATGEISEPGLQRFLEMSVTQCSALTFLITSREPVVLAQQARTWEQRISLEEGLAREDAILLLRRFDSSGSAGLRDAPAEELGELANHLGGFPRALESIAGMLLEDPLLRLDDLKRRVYPLDGDISTEAVKQAMAHLNPDSLRVLAAVSVFGQPVRYEGLAFLLTPFLPEETLRALLNRLVRACFIQANRATQQYALHPIDQAYCYSQIPAGDAASPETDPPPFTRATLHRRAARYYHTHWLPRPAWKTVSDLEPQLNESHHWVGAEDGDEAAKVLLAIDRDFLWEWDHKDLLRRLYPTLQGLVQDPHLVLQVARRQAWLNFFRAPQQADQEFQRLLQEARRLGFQQEEADALDDLAQTFRRGNRNSQFAIQYHQQALEIYRKLGDRRGEADALGGLGSLYLLIDPEESIDYFLAALTIHSELGITSSLSYDQSMLGLAYQYLGGLDQARQWYERSMQIARQENSLEALTRAYGLLAGLYPFTDEKDRIEPLLQEARAISKEVSGDPFSGQLIFYIGQTAAYLALLGDSSAAVELMEHTFQEVQVLHPDFTPLGAFYLGMVLTLAGEFGKASSLVPPDIENRLANGSGMLYWMGVLFVKTGDTVRAAAFFQKILNMVQPTASTGDSLTVVDNSRLPALALAITALALLQQDYVLAEQAAELTRQVCMLKNWMVLLHRALLELLFQEPGSQILAPVREVLSAHPVRPDDQ